MLPKFWYTHQNWSNVLIFLSTNMLNLFIVFIFDIHMYTKRSFPKYGLLSTILTKFAVLDGIAQYSCRLKKVLLSYFEKGNHVLSYEVQTNAGCSLFVLVCRFRSWKHFNFSKFASFQKTFKFEKCLYVKSFLWICPKMT